MSTDANILDKMIAYLSPERGLRRAAAREAMRGFDAGKLDSRTRSWMQQQTPNPGRYDDIQRLVHRSWDLYQNNQTARKIVNAAVAHVVGRGFKPESQAILPDGSPNEEFRRSCNQLWNKWTWYAHGDGLPGRGGLDLRGLAQLSFRDVFLSGETLIQFRLMGKVEQRRRKSPLPLVLDIIPASRLADQSWTAKESIADGNRVYRGIELDANGNRVAYWLYDEIPGDAASYNMYAAPTRYDASNIIHIYFQNQPKQLRGVPWLAASAMVLRDVGDLHQNETLASALRACLTVAIRRSGPGGNAGLMNGGLPSTDKAGNSIRSFQPGMFAELGPGEEFVSMGTDRPNMSVPDFADHMTRYAANGIHGLKASTVTGDYRGSSFSSERAAENSVWREVEQLQDWWETCFYQPIFDEVILSGVENFKLANAEGYYADPDIYTTASWSRPVRFELNPVDETKAKILKVQAGLLPYQDACNSEGTQWRDNLLSKKEVEQFASEQAIDPEFIQAIYTDQPPQQPPQEAAQNVQGA